MTKTQAAPSLLAFFAIIALSPVCSAGGIALSPDFTYQGELHLAGSPATGTFDFVFESWNVSSGLQVGPTLERSDVVVEDGIFNVLLDFGLIFTGDEVDLEIAVREGASTGSFTTLSPRQRMTSSPNALYARTGAWEGLLGVPSGFADNTDDDVLGSLSCSEGQVAVKAVGGSWQCGGAVSMVDSGSFVLDVENETNGYGIVGSSTATTGSSTGVLGYSTSTTGIGVHGQVQFGSGPSTGVKGETFSNEGTGVFGANARVSGTTYAVRGLVSSPDGFGGHFTGGRNYFGGPLGLGTESPLVALHLQEEDLGLDPAEVSVAFDDVVVEGTDSVVSLYSAGAGSFGSILSLGEVDGTGSMVDKWSLARMTSGASSGPDLRFYYGSAPNAGSNSAMMTLGSDGRVGIGTTSPGYLLHVDGDAGKPGGGSWTSASDRRLKRNIQDLDSALDSLARLRGVTFEYIDPETIHELPGERLGLIAQEVEEVFPDWVSTGKDGYKRVTIRGFEALAVEAFKELRAEKDAEIGRLEERIAELESLMRALLPRNAAEVASW